MTIDVIRSDEAKKFLQDATRQAEWSDLMTCCPWATPFQSPQFVGAWYDIYQAKWAPLLLLSRDPEGRLAGILPLAISHSGKKLAAAGTWHAEYQGWICRAEAGEAFGLQAARIIQHELRLPLSLHYLAPGTPLDWLSDPGVRRKCLVQRHPRPLLRLGDGRQIAQSLNKSSNKSRFRQLQKLGPVELQRITCPDQFESIFDQIIEFYDSRGVALRGSAPFLNDPCKKPLHLALMKFPGLLHATILRVGDQVASAHVGACCGKSLQLGLVTHNPWLSHYSPGKFHIYLLAQMLLAEGYDTLDLTAGGDAYKERFANDRDEVATLSIFPSTSRKRFAAVGVRVERVGRKVLGALGMTPHTVRSLRDKARRLGPLSLPVSIARSLKRPAKQCRTYSIDLGQIEAPAETPAFRRDSLADLLAYRPPRGWLSRREFLSESLERIEAGQHFYTCVEQGRLLQITWIDEKSSAPSPGSPRPASSIPTVSLLEMVTLPQARRPGLEAQVIKTFLRDIAGTQRILLAVPNAGKAVCRLLEGLPGVALADEEPAPADAVAGSTGSRQLQATSISSTGSGDTTPGRRGL